jgi:dynein heavy chain
MAQIAIDQKKADVVKKTVSEEEQGVKERALQTEAIARDAQKDLDEALPILEAAFKALDSLDKKDIAEMKAFSKPPELVMTVMEAICILFKIKPDWENSKKLLGDSMFLKKLSDFDKDNVPESVSKKLKKCRVLQNHSACGSVPLIYIPRSSKKLSRNANVSPTLKPNWRRRKRSSRKSKTR